MIKRLLDSAIDESFASQFVITEIHLGPKIMSLFIEEVKSSIVEVSLDIKAVTSFRGIPVIESYPQDTISYSIKLKQI